MANVAYDMLESVENLKSVHFSDDQAKMIVRVQKEILSDALTHTVAKTSDIFLLKQDMAEFKSEIRQDIFLLKQDILVLRQDMTEFKSELRQDMTNFKSEIRHEMNTLHSDMKWIKWIGGTIAAGILTGLIKLFLFQ